MDASDVAGSRTPARGPGAIAAIWAVDGGDKIARGELRATRGGRPAASPVWRDGGVEIFGARNEVIGFALVLEAPERDTGPVTVTFDRLDGPEGAVLSSGGADPFDWRGRPIELFAVRYLPIRGLSRMCWESYDERHIPRRFRRPGGKGGWTDRPDHDAWYPEMAVPMEAERSLEVAAGQSQLVWVDIAIPRDAAAGGWAGTIRVAAGGQSVDVPVSLTVRNFALPDAPTSKTMLYMGSDVEDRYGPDPRVRDRHFQLAHRHRITLFEADHGAVGRPSPIWEARLDGSLFTPARGYAGPGEGVGLDLYVVGAYGSWPWKDADEAGMRAHLDPFGRWFAEHHPTTEVLLYLIDESDDYPRIERWSRWVTGNPGPGQRIRPFATMPLPAAAAHTPSLSVVGSTLTVGETTRWEAARAGRTLVMYNGQRPASGSFCTEDDGVALRMIPWAQRKLGVHRWFFWESTYFHNAQGDGKQIDVWREARVFGFDAEAHAERGRSGHAFANGNGVLFYPGRDRRFPESAPGIDGPVASLRLKMWRRGIQDVDYIALAARVAPERTREIVRRMVPRVLWEVGVDDPKDPTWRRTDISWPTDPAVWEAARRALADIIEGR